MLDPQFGDNSFRRHLAAAESAGLRARVLESEELALDLDNPEDLDELRRRGGAPAASFFEGLQRAESANRGLEAQACAALTG
jgi:2-phospho-L-lactate guanylyltransferase (CobY/MobA/RfbA family)